MYSAVWHYACYVVCRIATSSTAVVCSPPGRDCPRACSYGDSRPSPSQTRIVSPERAAGRRRHRDPPSSFVVVQGWGGGLDRGFEKVACRWRCLSLGAMAPTDDGEKAGDDSLGAFEGDEEAEETTPPEPEPTPEEKGAALLDAAKIGNVDEVDTLVLAGAPLQHTDKGGWTPLLWASCNGHERCVATLLEAGAAEQLASPPPQEGGAQNAGQASPTKDPSSPVRPRTVAAQTIVNSPLHWAAFKGHLNIVFKLLLHGVPLTDVDGEGNTAIHLAAAGGDTSTALCLLNHGADLFAQNFFCNTPMDLGTKSEISSMLSSLALEKTYELAEHTDSAKLSNKETTATQWNGMRIDKVAYPTSRTLCTGVWCRESNAESQDAPGNGLGRFFSASCCVKQDVLDRKPINATTGEPEQLPPGFLCCVCMEQLLDIEQQMLAAMENKAKEPLAEQIATLQRVIAEAKRLGGSAAIISNAETALTRTRSEKVLIDYMAAIEEARPINDAQMAKKLSELLNEAVVQMADSELTTAGRTLLMSAEAEVGLSKCVAVFKEVELCLEMAHREDINRLKAAMTTSQRVSGEAG